jgi:hypothetical protein
MSISTALAADVLGVSRKQLDNLLLALGAELSPEGRQGKSRDIPHDSLQLIAVTLLLRRDLGLSAKRALKLAQRVSQSENGVTRLGVLASLHFDLGRLRSVLQQALASAVEDQTIPRRGRPATVK